MLRKGGSVKFTVPREFSFNRFNGMRASLKTSELHRILERKIMRPVWFWAEVHLTHSIKNTIRQSKGEIFQIQCCVQSGYLYNREVFFLGVTERDTLATKTKLLC